jgi:hypothetical protein
MAVDGVSNGTGLDRAELRRAIVTSSTKRRISELSSLQHQLEDDCMLVYMKPSTCSGNIDS